MPQISRSFRTDTLAALPRTFVAQKATEGSNAAEGTAYAIRSLASAE